MRKFLQYCSFFLFFGIFTFLVEPIGAFSGQNGEILQKKSLSVLSSPSNSLCSPDNALKFRTVQLWRYGKGSATGVLWDAETVLIATHSLHYDDPTKIWLTLASNKSQPVQASIVYSHPEADISILKLKIPLENITPITLKTASIGEEVRLVGLAFGQWTRLGVVRGIYQGNVQTNGQSQKAGHVTLQQRAFGGDSGAGIYTCDGQLAGLEFANGAPTGQPSEVYMVLPKHILEALEEKKEPVKTPLLSLEFPLN